jgi:CheY-like chemotaxis protein
LKDKKFLVVDDEQAVADFIRTVVELEGGTAVVAPTAASALECCRTSGPFDVMVLDVALPDTPGWELIAAARSFLNDCKFVIFSGLPPDVYAEHMGPAGVALSLVKPVAATALRDALQSVLHPAPAR